MTWWKASSIVTIELKISFVNQNPNIIKWYVGSLRIMVSYRRDNFQAMRRVGISDPSKCYFVDDNRSNIDSAQAEGWAKCVHFCEKGLEGMEGGKIKEIDNERGPGAVDNGVIDIASLEELRNVWPEIFSNLS
jgi:hypothetical protein